MGIDELLKMLNKKVDSLKEQKEREELQLSELQQLQAIVRKIQNNPFELYDLDNGEISDIFNLLSLGKEYLEKIEQYRIIYTGYLQFGREAIPQISLVEEFVEEIKEQLNNRQYQLSDSVAEYQYTIVQYNDYNELKEELSDPDKIISKFQLLSSFLIEQGISLEDQISIKLEINSKNNHIYEQQLLDSDKKEVEYLGECEIKIQEISDRLENEFNPLALNNLNAVSNLLSSCESKEEIERILNDWSFSFGDKSVIKIIEGIIALKNVELLTLKSIIEGEIDDYSDDLNAVDMQIRLLEEYKNDIQEVCELEDSSTVVDTAEIGKLEKALSEYTEDPLASPKYVLFLNDSIDRDIKAIDDRETLEDIFLLIEQLRQGELEPGRTSFRNDKKLRDMWYLKPSQKGRQARVTGITLGENIYGILHISAKKGDNPKSWIETLESRRKNSEVEYVKSNITEPQILEYYVTKTKTISSKLKNRVSAPYEPNVNHKLGGGN